MLDKYRFETNPTCFHKKCKGEFWCITFPKFSQSCTHNPHEAELTILCDRTASRCQWWVADYRTERLAVVVVVVIVISGHDAVMVNDSYSVSEKVAKKKTFWSCIVVALEIENVQRFKGRCIQADGKWATK